MPSLRGCGCPLGHPAPLGEVRIVSGRVRRVHELPRGHQRRPRPLWRHVSVGVLLLAARAGAAPKVFPDVMVNNLNAGRPLVEGSESLGVITSGMLHAPTNALPDDGFVSCSTDEPCYGAAGTTTFTMGEGAGAFRSMQSLKLLSRYCSVLPRKRAFAR